MEIIRILEKDQSRILPIYQECARWLKDKGLDQWSHYLSDEAGPLLERRFREGEVYVAALDGQDAAVVVLQWEDSFWGERGKDGTSGYLHSIAVRRIFQGRNIGKELILWATRQIAARGRSMVRLDCMKENPRLLRYYGELGFKEAGSIPWRGQEIQLFEMTL